MNDAVEKKEDPQSLAEKLRDDPETAVELEYRIRKEKLHNAIMAEIQRAYNAGVLEVKNIEDFCTLVKLDLFLLDEES